jgi:hypothetical protein
MVRVLERPAAMAAAASASEPAVMIAVVTVPDTADEGRALMRFSSCEPSGDM